VGGAAVTRYTLAENSGRSRLWLLPASARGGGRRPRDPARPLTAADEDCRQPVWSPDGKSLLFLRAPGAASAASAIAPSSTACASTAWGRAAHGSALRRPRPALVPRWPAGGLPQRDAAAALGVAGAAALRKAEDESPPQVRVTESRVYRYWTTGSRRAATTTSSASTWPAAR